MAQHGGESGFRESFLGGCFRRAILASRSPADHALLASALAPFSVREPSAAASTNLDRCARRRAREFRERGVARFYRYIEERLAARTLSHKTCDVDVGSRRWDPSLRPRPGASDALGRWVESLRRRLRENDSEDPRDVALQGAGLLLADPADRTGLAALQRARDLPSVRHTAFPSLIRAIARHATGEEVTFDERWMRRRPLHAQVSSEAAFWHLAASVHGVFGRASGDVVVHRNGRAHRLAMDEGRAYLSFATEENVELRVESEGNALVRVEAREQRRAEQR